MATTAQVFANREHSKFSTGPHTPEGKTASSQNSKAHGFCAADPVLPHEDRNQFNSLLERYKSDFEPTTAHEEFFVGQMAGARWKLDRAERIENAMFAALESPGDPATTEALMAQAPIAKAMTEKDTGVASPGSTATAPAWSAPTTIACLVAQAIVFCVQLQQKGAAKSSE